MNVGRRRNRAAHGMNEISLTPLIDVALVLLVIFMIATPIMQNSINIDLPRGHMKEDATGASKSSLIVTIDAQQRLHLNGEQYTVDKLLEELARKAKNAQETKVYVQCDKKAPAGSLVKIIDSIKYVAGIEHVVLTTERGS